MTNFHYETIQCPYCLNEEEIAIWDIIDASEDEDLKDKIFLKELQIFECQNCNRKYTLDQAMLYMDPNQKLMIYYAPKFYEAVQDTETRESDGSLKESITEHMPLDFGLDVSNHTLRIVTDYNELIEKLHIFDFELDDRVIEVLKIAVSLNPPVTTDEDGEEQSHKIDLIYFVGIEDGKHIYQTYTESDETWRQIVLEPNVYESAASLVQGDLVPESNWDIVDNTSAKIFLNNMQG